MHIKAGKTIFEILEANFSTIKADCLIFPTNNYLWMGNEITTNIKKLAGGKVEQEALQQAPANTGTAIVTSGGSLPFEFLIHAVCMEQDCKINDLNLKQSVLSSLNIMVEKKCTKAVLIPFFLANSGLSIFKTAEIIIDNCIDFCLSDKNIEKISIVDSDPQTITVFTNYMANKFSIKKK